MAPPIDSLPERSGRREPERRPDAGVDRTLSALGDADCRALLRQLAAGPQTAAELAQSCEIPSSTLYRKLDRLVDAGLVAEETEISTDGRNATRYEKRIDEVSVRIRDTDQIELGTDGSGDDSDAADRG